jgi:hypothetical protein
MPVWTKPVGNKHPQQLGLIDCSIDAYGSFLLHSFSGTGLLSLVLIGSTLSGGCTSWPYSRGLSNHPQD